MELEEIMTEPWLPSENAILLIESIGEEATYQRGDKLVEQGKKSNYFFIIKEGVCRSFYTDENYEDTNLFAKDGDIIGSICAYFRGEPAKFSIEALTAMNVIKIPFEKLQETLATNDELSKWIRDLLFGQLDALERRYYYRSGRNDAYSRFVSMVERWPHGRFNDIPLKFIAQYLQIAPQTLSRIRRKYFKQK